MRMELGLRLNFETFNKNYFYYEECSILRINNLIVSKHFSSCDARRTKLEAEAAREKFVKDSTERAYFVRDSIRKREIFVKDSIKKRENFVKDSIKAVQKAKDIARLSKQFRKRYDEFNSCTWVTHQTSPRDAGANAVYCYFATDGNQAENFRFVFQYYSDHWLFIEELVFSIDGCAYTIEPDWKHDVGSKMVAEWCDEPVTYKRSQDRSIDEELIKNIIEAKVVKIQMRGSTRYDVRTLTAAQKKSIKDTYEYYTLLGGTFRTKHK